MKIKNLINQINKDKIINNIYSRYWVCGLSMEIRENDQEYSKIDIIVDLFDRELKSFIEIDNITFLLNNKQYMVDRFQKLEDYVWRCKFSLQEVVENVVFIIKSYKLKNSNEVMLNTQYYIQGLEYVENDALLYLCQNVLNQKKSVLSPYYNDLLWFCSCGRIHSYDEPQCTCGLSLDNIKEICDGDIKEIIISNIKSGFEVNIEEDVKTSLIKYINNICNEFGVSKDILLNQFSISKLEKVQEKLINEECDKFLSTNSIRFDVKKSFDENINIYIDGGCRGLLDYNKIKSKMNISELQNKYNRERNAFFAEEKRKSEKRKRLVLITVIFVLAITLVFAIKEMLVPRADGIALQDTVENRVLGSDLSYDPYAMGYNVIENLFEGTNNTEQSEVIEILRKQGVSNVDSFLKEFRIYPDVSHLTDIKVGKPKGQKIDGKVLYPLSNDYFLVKQEDELGENRTKIWFYIGNNKGEKKYGDSNDYIITEYKDEKIQRQFIYIDDCITAKRTYTYEKGKRTKSNSYTYIGKNMDLDNKNNWKLDEKYEYDDEKVKKVLKKTEYGNEIEQVCKYKDGKLVLMNSVEKGLFREKLTKLSDIKCELVDGLISRVEYTDKYEKNETKIYYDNNGLVAGIEHVSNPYNSNDVKKFERKIYDFENGMLYNVVYYYNGEKYNLEEINYYNLDEGLSHFYGYSSNTATTVTSLSEMRLGGVYRVLYVAEVPLPY